MFRPKKPLQIQELAKVPERNEIYIIYLDGEPFYIGRSSVNIRRRLYAHATRIGSRKVREALELGKKLEFEWEELGSPQQAEAQLIEAFGTIKCGNLRRETDPAD